jgi:hypothetical protein
VENLSAKTLKCGKLGVKNAKIKFPIQINPQKKCLQPKTNLNPF